MTRRLVSLPLALIMLFAPTAIASAHELTVLDAGPATLDLGDASTPRLVHATLVEASDRLTLTVRARAALEVLVLVPDAEPERRTESRPRLLIEDVRPLAERSIRDEATGIDYLVVAEHSLDPQARPAPTALDITRGDDPTRVAVLVGPPDAEFAASDPDRTPRTVARLLAWAETPADGSMLERDAADESADPRAPAYGAAIALVAVLLAGWWVRTGRTRSRVRGAARSGDTD